MNISGILNVENFIKTTDTYKNIDFLSKIDVNSILNKLKKDPDYLNIIKDFNLIFLENSKNNLNEYENEFIDYFIKLKQKYLKLLDKLIRVSYRYESIGYLEQDINYDEYLTD